MDRVERICDLILQRGIRKKYIINARLEVARRPDVLRKMERAGFVALLLGIESAQDKTLRAMRKGFDTAKIREYCAVLRGYRISLLGYFILGNIGESEQEMLQIAPFAHELGLDAIILSILQARPYSGLDELVAANPAYHIAKNGKVFSDELSIKELRQLRGRINREFYTAGQVLQILGKGARQEGSLFFPACFRGCLCFFSKWPCAHGTKPGGAHTGSEKYRPGLRAGLSLHVRCADDGAARARRLRRRTARRRPRGFRLPGAAPGRSRREYVHVARAAQRQRRSFGRSVRDRNEVIAKGTNPMDRSKSIVASLLAALLTSTILAAEVKITPADPPDLTVRIAAGETAKDQKMRRTERRLQFEKLRAHGNAGDLRRGE